MAGCVIFEILTGCVLFKSTKDANQVQLLHSMAKNLQDFLLPIAGREFAYLMAALLEMKPEDRMTAEQALGCPALQEPIGELPMIVIGEKVRTPAKEKLHRKVVRPAVRRPPVLVS
jgi:hypothetical protein